MALLVVIVTLLVGCEANKRSYNYYKTHIDEAKSFSDQCTLNGTSGMTTEQVSSCNAARAAYDNRSFK
ncbi:EexN family lipoprotein [Herbaspirillum sp. RTI4]|nr:EexN family lipoprotein [Herbaspirillum sp. RTI4]MEA9982599.1 EexN family lipoprotein [Herbaspirillum sp. RTI4]